jgi:hypothetical protein
MRLPSTVFWCGFLLTWFNSMRADGGQATAADAVASLNDPSAGSVNAIFDTDMDSDCDDAGALAVLHALADRGEAKILAAISSSQNPWTAPCIEVINTWYGRGDLPIGAPRGKGPTMKSLYTRGVAESMPHKIRSTADAPDAMEVYRTVLERADDHSVVVITVGTLTNIANLLDLPADGSHPSGLELINRKVRLMACMGGNFVGNPARDDLKLGNHNFEKDPDATLRAIPRWPRPLIFVGREIGSVPSHLKGGARLAETTAGNPVRLAYQLYFGGIVKDRHLADPTTVLFAVRGLRDYWDIHATGHMDLHPDLTFDWKDGPAGNQAYLLKRTVDGKSNDHAIEQACEELMIQPPHRPGATTMPADRTPGLPK